MSKMKDMDITIKELRQCASVLVDTANFLAEIFSSSDEQTAIEPTTEKPKKSLTLEEVRAVLATKSKDGKTSAVKELLTSFGADKLSDVKPEQYAKLLEKAEVL